VIARAVAFAAKAKDVELKHPESYVGVHVIQREEPLTTRGR
jgi:hypothetical protein